MKKIILYIKSSLAFLGIVLNTVFMAIFIYPFIFLKLLPLSFTRKMSRRIINWFSEIWISINYGISQLFYGIEFEVTGLDHPEIQRNKSYLLISNHQAYTDIFILQSVLNRKIPMPKFFIKQELIWFPVLGLAWWGLEFPFVKRYSREKIKKNPKLARKDLANIQRMARKYRDIPTVIINFLEGHRRTPERMAKARRKNPYQYLLKPHAGGISVLMTSMKGLLHGVLDVTIVYPNDNAQFQSLISGGIRKIKVHIDFIPMTEVPVEKNIKTAAMSKNMLRWVNERWQLKNEKIKEELQSF